MKELLVKDLEKAQVILTEIEIAMNNGWPELAASLWNDSGYASGSYQRCFSIKADLDFWEEVQKQRRELYALNHIICIRCGRISWDEKKCLYC